jgi:hypothetical protein
VAPKATLTSIADALFEQGLEVKDLRTAPLPASTPAPLERAG